MAQLIKTLLPIHHYTTFLKSKTLKPAVTSLCEHSARSHRSISPAHMVLSSKPAICTDRNLQIKLGINLPTGILRAPVCQNCSGSILTVYNKLVEAVCEQGLG